MAIVHAADSRHHALTDALRDAGLFDHRPLPEDEFPRVRESLARLPLGFWHDRGFRRPLINDASVIDMYALEFETLLAHTEEEPIYVGAQKEAFTTIFSAADLPSLVPRLQEEEQVTALVAGTEQERACPECWGEGTSRPGREDRCSFCGGEGFVQRWTGFHLKEQRVRHLDWVAFPHHFLNVAVTLDYRRQGTPLGRLTLEAREGNVVQNRDPDFDRWEGTEALADLLTTWFQRKRSTSSYLKEGMALREEVRVYRVPAVHVIAHRWWNHEVFLHLPSRTGYARSRPPSPTLVGLAAVALGYLVSQLIVLL